MEVPRPPAPPPLWLVVVSSMAFAVLYLFLHRGNLTLGWLEDLPIYQKAVNAFLAGRDPYAQTYFGFHFVYPPFVLYPISWLARLMPGESEWPLLVSIHVACWLATPLVLARYYFRSQWLTQAVACFLFFAEADFTSMRALFSANVAPTLYLSVLLALAPGLRRNRWNWFYVVILVTATVKVTFTLLLLFPLLAGARQWLRSICVAAVVTSLYALQRLRLPALYAGYKWALTQQLSVMKMYGYGVFGTAATFEQKLHASLIGSYIAHTLFAITLLALLFGLKRRGAYAAGVAALPGTQRNESTWLGVLLMSVIIVNPRVLHYDMYLALFAAFVTLASVFKFAGGKLILFAAVLYLPCLVVVRQFRPWLIPQTYSVSLVLFALAAGIWHLWRATSPIEGSESRYRRQQIGESESLFVVAGM